MSETFVDPYLDPITGVLRNLVSATTYEELQNAEGEFVALRTAEVLASGFPAARGTIEDFCRIHRALFQDVYDWAGEVRTVEIRKNVEGSEFFLPSPNIPMGFQWAQSELDQDAYLKGMPLRTFAERLAYHFDNYNFIHPFREGNGRVQRLFWTLICHEAGWDLDWRRVNGAENDEASRLAAEDRDYRLLVSIFERIASPCDPGLPIGAEMVLTGHLE